MESNTETYTRTFSIDVERANYHLKCKKRKRKRILIVIIVWLIIFAYMFTPVSKINFKVEGNVYYTKDDLMDIAYINKNEYWWLFNSKKAKKVIDSYPFIEKIEFTKSFLGVKAKINEVYPVAIKDNKYVMSNNDIIEKESYDLNYKVNELICFDNVNDEDLQNLVNKYKDISLNIRNNFYNLEIIKDSNEYRYVKLFGNDAQIGYYIIKLDLVYLNTKFNENKYNKIIESISKNNVKYEKEQPAFIAYHYLNEEEFKLVDNFEEE